jgi:hypothetical protein
VRALEARVRGIGRKHRGAERLATVGAAYVPEGLVLGHAAKLAAVFLRSRFVSEPLRSDTELGEPSGLGDEHAAVELNGERSIRPQCAGAHLDQPAIRPEPVA